MRLRSIAVALLLLVAACSDSSTSTTTTAPATSTSTSTSTTTTEAEETTTTTTAEETTTTTGVEETTTTTEQETTSTTDAEGEDETETTFPPTPTTSSTTIPDGDVDDALIGWAGVFRAPTGYDRFIQFRADGVVRAGTAFDSMPFEGSWDVDPATSTIILSGFDIGGTGCGDTEGRYTATRARGGGRTLTLDDDPCGDRVAFLTLPGAECACMTWLRVVEAEDD